MTTAGQLTIEGEIEYVVGEGAGEQTISAREGGSVWIPRGTRHAFKVTSETSRVLNFYTPGGFDEGDYRGFPNDPEKRRVYLNRIADLHSQTGLG